ncbi:MAG TPA: type II toxin-antitoxin system RelE/ParE family toxin [Epulopiscium sp.]|nr:type II toxin-antitoxin system RelE/ParE family toxin [Candidatus Epulonipiscium sp.]
MCKTNATQNDFKEIIDYLNTLSPQAALEYYDLIVEKTESLSEMPNRCPLVRDLQLKVRSYRTLVVKSYIVFYVISHDTVQIHRILYGRRQYKGLL